MAALETIRFPSLSVWASAMSDGGASTHHHAGTADFESGGCALFQTSMSSDIKVVIQCQLIRRKENTDAC